MTEFWRNRTVFVTGHTGFKGGWLVAWLRRMGARVSGYALAPDQSPSLFEQARIAEGITSVIADVRDAAGIDQALHATRPEIVFHLAAQPLVRLSYAQPVTTFATNVLGTVNVLEAVRNASSVRAVVVVTTDKCYEDRHSHQAYRETDPLGGHDPYASSKACAELVTRSYRDAFLAARGVGVATARGGNVVGGGDWTTDRLVPDILDACERGTAVHLRYPDAVRPWQHVLDLLAGYLALAERLTAEPGEFAGPWNFGPDDRGDVTVRQVAEEVVQLWGEGRIECDPPAGLHESAVLRLDSTKARQLLRWQPRLSLDETLRWTVDWHRQLRSGHDARELVEMQIEQYEDRTA